MPNSMTTVTFQEMLAAQGLSLDPPEPTAFQLEKEARERLAALEPIIERGVAAFIEAGFALREIRDARLYRVTHPTFEAYLRARWGWSRAHGYRMIDAAAVAVVAGTNLDTGFTSAEHGFTVNGIPTITCKSTSPVSGFHYIFTGFFTPVG